MRDKTRKTKPVKVEVPSVVEVVTDKVEAVVNVTDYKKKILMFLSSLEVKVLKDKEYKLTAPFTCQWGDDIICVPKGYVTDFASVPKLPFFYLMVGETGHLPAVIHDYGYTEGLYTKEEVDYYFYRALRKTGVNWVKANIMWIGVRLGGRSHGKRR